MKVDHGDRMIDKRAYCKYCGGYAGHLVEEKEYGFYVECVLCKARGSVKDSDKEAVRVWEK